MDVVTTIFLVFYVIAGFMFLMIFNRIWKWRARVDEEDLALREQELEVRKKLLTFLTEEEHKALDKALKPRMDLLMYEMESRAEAAAEAMYEEVRARLNLPAREEHDDDRPTG